MQGKCIQTSKTLWYVENLCMSVLLYKMLEKCLDVTFLQVLFSSQTLILFVY